MQSDSKGTAGPTQKGSRRRVPEILAVAAVAADFLAAIFMPREAHFLLNASALVLLCAFRVDVFVRNAPLVWPLAVICLMSVAVTIFVPGNMYDLMKGGLYILRAPMYLLLGAMISGVANGPQLLVKGAVAGAWISSAHYIWRYIQDPNISVGNRTYLRKTLGTGSVLWGPIIGLFMARPKMVAANGVRLNLIATLGIVMVAGWLSTSRSTLLAAVLIFFAMRVGIKQENTLSFLLLAIIFLFLLITTPILAMLGLPVGYQWLQDLPNFGEMAPVRQGTLQGINNGWRGHETYLAFEQIFEGGGLSVLVGSGLASTVHLGFSLSSKGVLISDIPIFHNGFSYLFVRAGLLGLLLYAIQFVVLASHMLRAPWGNGYQYFGSGLLLFMALSTASVSGLFNPDETGSTLLMLIGALAAISPGRNSNG